MIRRPEIETQPKQAHKHNFGLTLLYNKFQRLSNYKFYNLQYHFNKLDVKLDFKDKTVWCYSGTLFTINPT
jgi:hypothetical protein